MNHNNKIDCLYLNKLSNTIVDRLMCIAFVFSKTIFAALFTYIRITKTNLDIPIDVIYSEYQFALNYIDNQSKQKNIIKCIH